MNQSEVSPPPAVEPRMTGALILGSLLGLSAASVGLIWQVGPLNLSSAFLVAALVLAFLIIPTGTLGTFRIRAFDWIALGYAVMMVVIENIDASTLRHDPSPAYSNSALYYFAAYLAARLAIHNLAGLRRLLIGIAWPGIPVAILGVLQLAGFQPVSDFLLTQTNSSALINRTELGAAVRATSTIGHWTALGAYLCCIVAVACVVLVIDKNQRGRLSPFALITIAIGSLGIVSTVTFASIMVVAVVVLVTGYVAGIGGRLIVLLTIGSGIAWGVFGTLITDRLEKQATTTANIPPELAWLPQTIGFRLVLWFNEGIPTWLQQPVFGWGQGLWHDSASWPTLPASMTWAAPESEWIKALAASGVVGFILLMLLLGGFFTSVVRARKSDLGRAAIPLLALLIGLVIASFIAPYFTNQGAPAVLWPVIGALAWTANSRDRKVLT
ncbi:hypothetical protein B7R22_02840 [Subtercola boreus]|uniref:O-antigen polymerase n=1 Tax=Subtercola boreus TaxID=120213 RepID=A0A3E0W3X4_9MICO|nr:hypothetical protein [Subtercola boreus]RFA16439.1 hypothetical protein B7R22_02840 [Subtercola boreus]